MASPNFRGWLEETIEQDYGGAEYSELGILAAALRGLSMVHQSHHWAAMGDQYYGDHLLFDRIYSKTNEHVDLVAERAVGLSVGELVEPRLMIAVAARAMSELFMSSGEKEFAASSLAAEEAFLALLNAAKDALDEQGKLTYGVDNLLAQVADDHEGLAYLLHRRVQDGH